MEVVNQSKKWKNINTNGFGVILYFARNLRMADGVVVIWMKRDMYLFFLMVSLASTKLIKE